MFNGKKKAVTFSYDDGVTQDIRLVELLNRYGLKATFNLNSELLGKSGSVPVGDVTVDHNKIAPSEVASLYRGHEVAAHTLTHPNLTTLSEEEIVRQVAGDMENLSELCGYEVVGMAYPCGGVNNDERVAEILARRTGVRYARTIGATQSFDLQKNLLRFDPTISHRYTKVMFDLAERFIAMEPKEPQLFYIWGHSYELDVDDGWNKLEEFCKLISARDDIFYGTNREVLLAENSL